MDSNDPERQQRLGVLLAWGVLAVTAVGMFSIGIRFLPLGLNAISVLLLGVLVVALGKASLDAAGADPGTLGGDADERDGRETDQFESGEREITQFESGERETDESDGEP